MRSFILDVAIPTAFYFIGVTACVGLVCFTALVATDIVSDPTGIMQEDRQ